MSSWQLHIDHFTIYFSDIHKLHIRETWIVDSHDEHGGTTSLVCCCCMSNAVLSRHGLIKLMNSNDAIMELSSASSS